MIVNERQFKPKTLVCMDCGQPFIFGSGEQRYFLSKELGVPRRCPQCRLKRRLSLVFDSEVRNG